VTENGWSFEMYDAQAALVHIGKHHGLFVDRQEQSGDVTLRIVDQSSDANP
jgi:hypothetical protein